MKNPLRFGAIFPIAPCLLAVAGTGAQAALPDPVRAMIDAAIETGDADKVATIAELAKATNPDDVDEIDAVLAAFDAEQARLAAQAAEQEERAIREAGLFDNWSGRGQLGAFRSTGNSSNTGVTAALKLQREGIDWRHKLSAVADYQRNNGVTTREQFRIAYEPNYKLSGRLYLYGLGQYERDRFQGFSARYAASAGLGYLVIDDDAIQLSVDGGPAYRRTELIGGGTTEQLGGRAALDLEWQIADSIKLTEDATAILQSRSTTLLASTGVEIKIDDSMSAGFAYVIEHETDPPAGSVKTDTLTRITLIYDF